MKKKIFGQLMSLLIIFSMLLNSIPAYAFENDVKADITTENQEVVIDKTEEDNKEVEDDKKDSEIEQPSAGSDSENKDNLEETENKEINDNDQENDEKKNENENENEDEDENTDIEYSEDNSDNDSSQNENDEDEDDENNEDNDYEITSDIIIETVESMASQAVLFAQKKAAAYAMLYSDGYLVFQRGNAVDSSHGKLIASYTGFETGTSVAKLGSSNYYWLAHKDKIKHIETVDVISPINMQYWFHQCYNLETVDLSMMDTSKVTSMEGLFAMMTSMAPEGWTTGNNKLKSLDLSGFDTSKVTVMSYMFTNLRALEEVDVSGFNTSNVIRSSSMFANCFSLNSVDVSNFDMSNNESTGFMFYNCRLLEELDLSNFNTPKLKFVDNMFNGCENLRTLDLSSFSTKSMRNFEYMCNGCSKLESINLDGWTLPSADIRMDAMFKDCSSLKELNLKDFDTRKIQSMTDMLSGATGLEILTLGKNFKISNDWGLYSRTWWNQDAEKFKTDTIPSVTYGIYSTIEPVAVTVTFDSDGGSEVNPVSTYVGKKISSPSTTKTGFDFVGWFDGDTKWDFNTPVSDNMTLTAHWEAKSNLAISLNIYVEDLDVGDYVLSDTKTLKDGVFGQMYEYTPEVKTGFDVNTEKSKLTVDAVSMSGNEINVYYDIIYIDVKIVIVPDTDLNLENEEFSIQVPYGSVLKDTDIPEHSTITRDEYLACNITLAEDADGKVLYKLSTPITEEVTIYKLYTLKIVNYTVKHYVEGNDDYELADTDKLSGKATSTVEVTPKKYKHYDLEPSELSLYIKADGTSLIELRYSKKVYTVNVDGVDFQVKYNETVSEPEHISKVGYTASGWEDETGTTFDFSVPVDSDKTVKTVFTPNTDTKYLVKEYFETVDGNWEEPIITELQGTSDSEVTVSNITSRENFVPDNENKKITIAADGSSVVEFRYSRVKRTLTTNVEGTIKTYEYRNESVVEIVPTDAVKEGYKPVVWMLGDAAVELPLTMDKDITLVATFEPNEDTPYKVEYYQENKFDDNYTLFKTTDLTGTTDTEVEAEILEFTGFSLKEGQNTSAVISGDGKTVIKLYYDRNIVKVTTESGEEIETKYDTPITPPEYPEKPGYVPTGWEKSDGSEFDPTENIVENITIKPVYEPGDSTYTVKHYLKELSGEYKLDKTVTKLGITDTIGTADPIDYKGFSLITEVLTANINGIGDTVIELYYDRNIVKVKIEDGVNPREENIVFGDTLDEPSIPEKDGYTATEWVDENGNVVDFTKPVEDPMTIRPNYIPDGDVVFKVEHYKQTLAGDYELSDTVPGSGTTDTTVTAEAKEYKGFAIKTEDLTGVIKGDGSLVIKVYYDRVTVKVIIDNEGELIEKDVIFEDKLEKPELPGKPGYDIPYYIEEDTSIVDFDDPITDPKTIKPYYVPRDDTPYKVEYYLKSLADEYILDTTENLTGTTDTTVTAVVKEYRGFNVVTEELTANLNGDGSTVIRVYYDRAAYKVMFNVNGGSLSGDAEQTILFEGTVTLPSASRSGYTFDGWYTSLTGGTKVTGEEKITKDTTYYALWNRISYPDYPSKPDKPDKPENKPPVEENKPDNKPEDNKPEDINNSGTTEPVIPDDIDNSGNEEIEEFDDEKTPLSDGSDVVIDPLTDLNGKNIPGDYLENNETDGTNSVQDITKDTPKTDDEIIAVERTLTMAVLGLALLVVFRKKFED